MIFEGIEIKDGVCGFCYIEYVGNIYFVCIVDEKNYEIKLKNKRKYREIVNQLIKEYNSFIEINDVVVNTNNCEYTKIHNKTVIVYLKRKELKKWTFNFGDELEAMIVYSELIDRGVKMIE